MTQVNRFCFMLLLVAIVAPAFANAAESDGTAGFGLTVKDGILHKDGKPYRGIGVNYFNAFARHLKDPNDTSYDAGFQSLTKAKIPFVRMMACGFYPIEQKLHRDNPEEFFRRMDDVVKSAEKNRIGLILSFFWTTFTVPDLVGESIDQWGNPQSKTHQYMQQYVHDVVTRYRNSPAVWGWEFGNEYNLAADLPNAKEHRPRIFPELGTPGSRSEKDELSCSDIHAAFSAFAQEVRKYDPYRMITTGNSIPRNSAWHNWKEKSWTADTPEQQTEIVLNDNPDPIDVISVHIYEEEAQAVETMMADASRAGKPLFIGEFGGIKSPESYQQLLKNIERFGVPLAALWVFDFPPQDADYNITWTNARSYQLEAIVQVNARISEKLKQATN